MKKSNLCKSLKVLVTGATGFIGTHLVFSLLEYGHEVAILKRKDSGLKGLTSIQDKVQVFTSDTYHYICTGIKNFSPDVVIHLAALYINQHESGQIVDMINSNIVLGTNILEAMIKNNIMRFVNIGTRWQHLGNKRYNPANLYSATKEAFKSILAYYETKGIKYKTLEFSDTYGTGDTRKKIMELLITACQKEKKIDLTSGEQMLDLIAVNNITTFITTSINSSDFFDNKTLSISGTVIRLRDLGEMIEREFKVKGLFNWGGKPYRENETMTPPFYYRRIQLNQNSLETYIKNIAAGTI
jgi:nucleoside-diphosphate-sugar epimerase